MQYRSLGRTGQSVSALSFGTVSLGVDYGIESPGEFGRPTAAEAINLLRMAADGGINLYDTAPAYGESETLLGKALAKDKNCLFATKVALPLPAHGQPSSGAALRPAILASLENSLRNLKRDCLDIVQIHNATVASVDDGDVVEVLQAARQQGKLRYLGASVYTEAEAIAVIDAGCFELLQLPFSILDQRPVERVLKAAAASGVAILNRSALLKGVLSPKGRWLPAALAPLRRGAEQVVAELARSWESLPETALRFCLSVPQITSVLIGARTEAELQQALAAERRGSLTATELAQAEGLALDDSCLLNPSTWPVS